MNPKEQTGMAAEFHVLSALWRLGFNALLTLGNHKQVDIVVERPGKSPLTIDVKGLRGKTEWPVGSDKPSGLECHYFVFVSFENNISTLEKLPTCFVVPESEVLKMIKQYKAGRRNVAYKALRGSNFENNWDQLSL